MPYRFVRPRRAERRVQSDSYFAGPWGAVVFVGVLVAAGFGVIALIRRTYEGAETDKNEAAAHGSILGKGKSAAGGPGPRGSGEPRKGTAIPAGPSDAKLAFQRALHELNVAVITKEVARYRGDPAGAGRQASAAVSAAERLQTLAGPSETIPDHLEPSDMILAVDGDDVESMKSDDAAARLSKTLRPEAGNAYFKFRVRRAGGIRELHVFVPRDAGASASEYSQTGRIKISSYMGLEIQKQVLSLPPNVLPQSERDQIERVLGRGEATPDEYALITRRLASNDSGQIEQERESFKTQIAALQKMLPTAPVGDTALTKDGRRITGLLAADTQRAVQIDTPYGKVEILRPDLVHLYVAKEVREEFDTRLQGSRDNLQALAQLLLWTRDWQMPAHREYVAYLMLQLNPNDAVARGAAGYYHGPGGKWVLGNSIAAGAKPAIKVAETRGELQAELESMGFTLNQGHWYTKVPWTSGIDTLHFPGNLKMSMSGCQIITWHESDTPQSRLFNPSGKPKDGSPPRLRFIGPTGATGSVTITVDAPNEIFECKLRANGHIVEGSKQAKIECFITPEGSSTQSLYSITAGGEELYHDVSSFVRGKKRFSITAHLTTQTDKYQAYARFLQSLPDTKEVFWVHGTVLQPAPDVDKTWNGTRP